MAKSTLRALAVLAAVALSACGQKKPIKEIEEPLPPAPYGEEESNVDLWLDTLEVGSRELYAARDAVVAAANVAPGARVADIGAGTGLYSLMFAERVGAQGVVYAVDIEPRFLKLIAQRSADNDLKNVVAVLGQESDVTLPPGSVDLAFIADTYHYFTDPEVIMRSIYDALAPGGRLILLDYTLSGAAEAPHPVRVGKDGVREEVEAVGFRLVEEPEIEGLQDIYALVFERP